MYSKVANPKDAVIRMGLNIKTSLINDIFKID